MVILFKLSLHFRLEYFFVHMRCIIFITYYISIHVDNIVNVAQQMNLINSKILTRSD